MFRSRRGDHSDVGAALDRHPTGRRCLPGASTRPRGRCRSREGTGTSLRDPCADLAVRRARRLGRSSWDDADMTEPGPLALVGGDELKRGNEPQDRVLVEAAGDGPAFVLATAAGRQRPDMAVENAV